MTSRCGRLPCLVGTFLVLALSACSGGHSAVEAMAEACGFESTAATAVQQSKSETGPHGEFDAAALGVDLTGLTLPDQSYVQLSSEQCALIDDAASRLGLRQRCAELFPSHRALRLAPGAKARYVSTPVDGRVTIVSNGAPELDAAAQRTQDQGSHPPGAARPSGSAPSDG
ncbi:hypothetical protein [Luteococcus peritonei]|uniref:Secreted protein n=1 Tax=Luteococcus peritonei TaxID=88874 RepID=A0ABW4RW18_9ACTN